MTLDDWITKFEAAGITDLDSEVHELKSQEASDINNAGLGSQLEFLLEKCGESFLQDLLGPTG